MRSTPLKAFAKKSPLAKDYVYFPDKKEKKEEKKINITPPNEKESKTNWNMKPKPSKQEKFQINKRVGVIPGQLTGKKLTDVLPIGASGDISATYKPNKDLTISGGYGGSVSKHGTQGGGRLSINKKGKNWNFGAHVSKGKGSPTFGASISRKIGK